MYRPRSATALNVQSWSGEKLSTSADFQQQTYPSPTERSSSRSSPVEDYTKSEISDDYSGAKKEVSTYKRVKGRCLWLKHKMLSCINSEWFTQAFAACVLLLMVMGMWLIYAHMLQQSSQAQHLVVLDAGSTGTRVHVFSYSANPRSSYAVLKLPEPKLKVEPGLSAFAKDAAGAGASLRPLLKFAQQHVPAHKQQSTPVYLMATAGLRLLPEAEAGAILDYCRRTLFASPFLFKSDWASIIDGQTEGLYGWVAANYAAGNLQAAARNMRSRKVPQQTHGAFKALIEMGGASSQVVFLPDGQWHSSSGNSSKGQQGLRLALPGVSRPLWSHSYLGYGFDVVEQKVHALVQQQATAGSQAPTTEQAGQPVQRQREHSVGLQSAGHEVQVTAPAADTSMPMDPCLPAGYIATDGRTGSGEWQQCQQLVVRAINPTNCKTFAEQPCPEIPSHMPQLSGQLVAIENFAYTARALELPEHSSVGEFALAARRFCSRPWPQTLQRHSAEPQQLKYLWRYCFGSAFSWTLLHDVLHLGEGQQVHFTNTLKSSEGQEVGLDWALGAAVLQLSRGAGSEQGVLLAQQQRVLKVVLVAALLGTLALLVALGVGISRLCSSREAAKQQAMHPGLFGKDIGSDRAEGVGGIWTYVADAPGRGVQLYSALPVSTRVSY